MSFSMKKPQTLDLRNYNVKTVTSKFNNMENGNDDDDDDVDDDDDDNNDNDNRD